jgi:hypothetical protein
MGPPGDRRLCGWVCAPIRFSSFRFTIFTAEELESYVWIRQPRSRFVFLWFCFFKGALHFRVRASTQLETIPAVMRRSHQAVRCCLPEPLDLHQSGSRNVFLVSDTHKFLRWEGEKTMVWVSDGLSFRALAVICSLVIAPGQELLYAQTPPQPRGQTPANQGEQFVSPEQLDSLVAPIALYPDPLVGQILAASTYPLQIVTAHRWVQQNSNLKGKSQVEAAGRLDWDPSIQALVAFPSVLQMMDRSLDWTTALGNAFLSQQADVMAAVQRMRMKARQSGTLQSNAQQQVQTTTLEGQPAIVIQPADSQVMYVPSYDPTEVYGAAPEYYPYPPVSYPTGDVIAAGAISFGLGVAVGAIFNGCCGGGWGWGWGCNWGRSPSLYVNNNFFNHNGNTFVNRGNWGNAYRGNGQVGWNHNPRYRGAVPYPNRDVANRFNSGRAGLRPTQLPANMGAIKPPGSLGSANRFQGNVGANRPGGRGRPSQLPANAGANRPGGGRTAVGQMPAAKGSANRLSQGGQWGGWGGSKVSPGNRGGAFGGGSAGQARAFSNRGARSMGGGGRGGGLRGGGRRGGGRRR